MNAARITKILGPEASKRTKMALAFCTANQLRSEANPMVSPQRRRTAGILRSRAG